MPQAKHGVLNIGSRLILNRQLPSCVWDSTHMNENLSLPCDFLTEWRAVDQNRSAYCGIDQYG
jgi:hypothetical protein